MSCLFFQVLFLCSPVSDAFLSQRHPCVQLLVSGLGDSANREKDKGSEAGMEGGRGGGTDRQRQRGKREEGERMVVMPLMLKYL